MRGNKSGLQLSVKLVYFIQSFLKIFCFLKGIPWTAVLGRIFGPKRDEVAGEWRKLHNEELYDLYCSPNIFRVNKPRMRWAGHVARMGDRRGVLRGEERCVKETTWKTQA
jgi:hypothetical protein